MQSERKSENSRPTESLVVLSLRECQRLGDIIEVPDKRTSMVRGSSVETLPPSSWPSCSLQALPKDFVGGLFKGQSPLLPHLLESAC